VRLLEPVRLLFTEVSGDDQSDFFGSLLSRVGNGAISLGHHALPPPPSSLSAALLTAVETKLCFLQL
jgi:hypothetical protein